MQMLVAHRMRLFLFDRCAREERGRAAELRLSFLKKKMISISRARFVTFPNHWTKPGACEREPQESSPLAQISVSALPSDSNDYQWLLIHTCENDKNGGLMASHFVVGVISIPVKEIPSLIDTSALI